MQSIHENQTLKINSFSNLKEPWFKVERNKINEGNQLESKSILSQTTRDNQNSKPFQYKSYLITEKLKQQQLPAKPNYNPHINLSNGEPSSRIPLWKAPYFIQERSRLESKDLKVFSSFTKSGEFDEVALLGGYRNYTPLHLQRNSKLNRKKDQQISNLKPDIEKINLKYKDSSTSQIKRDMTDYSTNPIISLNSLNLNSIKKDINFHKDNISEINQKQRMERPPSGKRSPHIIDHINENTKQKYQTNQESHSPNFFATEVKVTSEMEDSFFKRNVSKNDTNSPYNFSKSFKRYSLFKPTSDSNPTTTRRPLSAVVLVRSKGIEDTNSIIENNKRPLSASTNKSNPRSSSTPRTMGFSRGATPRLIQ